MQPRITEFNDNKEYDCYIDPKTGKFKPSKTPILRKPID